MKFLKIQALSLCVLLCAFQSFAQNKIPQRKLVIKKTSASFKIDGILNEPGWQNAPLADSFTCLRPTPFKPEGANPSQVYFLYNDEGIFVGGYLYEKNKDSIAMELKGRDGFGNNDFIGIIFDTYHDRLNGFEYFVTPLGEQWDAKFTSSNDNSEDFSWNAVWESKTKLLDNGWSFEMFIPYSAIRFGKKNIQDWGLNIVRKRRRSDEQLFWQPIDPNINGFLTQSGMISGFENIKPPMRLQFSPYLSSYFNHDDATAGTPANNKSTFNGGMDVKYGINQAFTLDMTLIPDFGQVPTDNSTLNLSPFEIRFNENRTFFTEGTELFNKGNLFYSRRIGRVGYKPLRYDDAKAQLSSDEKINKNPEQVKLINATKISGRTQKGLGIGILNAVTNSQFASIQNTVTGEKRKYETEPLTNYNIVVLDQTLKNNSSVSLVNTNVLREGNARDANVSSFLFDLNDKKNTWNVGGNVSVSMIKEPAVNNKSKNGYAHGLYLGKTSGRLNFRFYQDLYDAKYEKSDMGYFTNNNYLEHGLWVGYNWLKPKKEQWYNQMRLNYNIWYNRLVTPIDALRRSDLMFQNFGTNVNGSAQTKKLWWFGFSVNINSKSNDFYEPRAYGKVFRNKGTQGMSLWYESNAGKKFYWSASAWGGTGGIFKRKAAELSLTARQQFSSKFTLEHALNVTSTKNQAGWAAGVLTGSDYHTLFARRTVESVENVMNVKYSFNNKMGITFRGRHTWTKVEPQQLFELDENGYLQTPSFSFNENLNQNYNFLSADLVYNWQFAQGSFLTVVWKDIGEQFSRDFRKNYFNNLGKTIEGNQFSSFSVRMIYFLDYLTAKKKLKKTRQA